MVGAKGEDYVFMPGEKLDDLFKKPSKYTEDEYMKIVSKDSSLTFFERFFMFVAKFWKKIRGSVEDDVINRPYMAHFYDLTRPENDRGLNIDELGIKFQSALDRIKAYWDLALAYYKKEEYGNAFCALGHIVHLVSDLHVPAHVHNDPHGPTLFLGKLDSLEQWAKRADYPHIQRGKGKMNITIWDSSPLAPPEKDHTWTPENVYSKIEEFVNGIARNTQKFRSVDAFGTEPDQKIKGKLTDDECYAQASVLIPSAIFNSAQIMVNFVEYAVKYDEHWKKQV